MLFKRIRITGIALICAALTVAVWKNLAGGAAVVREDSFNPVSPSHPASGEQLTIPVEIVVSGEDPQVRDIRVAR